MVKIYLRIVTLVAAALVLSACFGPKTPQEVTEAFWEAVIANDAGAAVKYSTLTDPQDYDAFGEEWVGYYPSWGRVVIEENRASIVSEFYKSDSSGKASRKFVTHLIKQDDSWRVDYARTAEEISGGPLGNLFGALDRLGNKISKQLQSSAKEFNAEMQRMSDELEALAESYGEQASESIERYSEELRQSIDELSRSIDRALEEQKNNLSDEDRRTMKEVATDLEQDRERLSNGDMESIAAGSKGIGDAVERLETVNDEVVMDYKDEWRKWRRDVEADMKRMLEELSRAVEG